jgi:hypothetical protein
VVLDPHRLALLLLDRAVLLLDRALLRLDRGERLIERGERLIEAALQHRVLVLQHRVLLHQLVEGAHPWSCETRRPRRCLNPREVVLFVLCQANLPPTMLRPEASAKQTVASHPDKQTMLAAAAVAAAAVAVAAIQGGLSDAPPRGAPAARPSTPSSAVVMTYIYV